LHYYHSDQSELEKTITTGESISNPDTLLLSKNESDLAFGFLNKLISGVATDAGKIKEFMLQLDSETLPIAFKNIGNVVLAEAARRHNNFSVAANRLSKITNPCLHQLTDKWLTRFKK
jgi:hypothetical protein